jgi:hypothetical protein
MTNRTGALVKKLISRRSLLVAAPAIILARSAIAQVGQMQSPAMMKPAPSGGGGNPFSLVAHTAAASTNTTSVTTTAINTTGANLIVVGVCNFNDPSLVPTDSAINTWTACTPYKSTTANFYAAQIFYCYSPATSSSHAFGANQTSSYPSIAVMAFSGSAASPFDQENGFGTISSVTSIQPGSVTPTANNELIATLVGFGNASSATATADSGFTTTDSIGNLSNSVGIGMAYLKQTTAAAVNPAWSWTGSSPENVATIATFK